MTHATIAAPAASHQAGYGGYWIAWGVLLALTVGMLTLGQPVVLLVGIACKAAIIVGWFMHLRAERWDFAAIMLVAIFATSALLFGLISADGFRAP